MKKWLGYYIGFILLLLAGTAKVEAQIDPTLAGMILGYTNKAEKELKSQEKAMLMQTTGHLWMREEVEGTTDLQRTFNNYLDSFRDIVCYAAQIYGFYHEIGRLSDNMGDLSKQLRQHAEGAFAVALTPRRNQIYRDLILGSVEIVNDIRQVCMNNTKMTEKQRMEIVFAMRCFSVIFVLFIHENDGEATHGDCIRHTPQAETDEQEAEASGTRREIYLVC